MKKRQANLFTPIEEEITASTDTHITLSLQKDKKEILSSIQKKFNSLTKRIQKQKVSLEQIPQKTEYLKRIYNDSIFVIRNQSKEIAMDNLKEIANKYDTVKFTTKRKEELGNFLMVYVYALKESFEEDEEVQTLTDEFVDRYWETVTFQSKAERTQEEINMVLNMAEAFFCEDFEDLAADAIDADDLMEKIVEKMRNEEEKVERDEKKDQADVNEADTPPMTEKKKTKKAAQKELQAQMEQKTVRNIYIELVKELHPDLAKDEDDRLLKETRMKQLTEAYRQKDLYALLTMQFNWLQESAQDFSRQPDEVLKQYNKLMNQQLKQMQDEYDYYCSLPIPGLPPSFSLYLQVENQNHLNQLLHDEKLDAAAFLSNEQSLKEILADAKSLKQFIDRRIANNKRANIGYDSDDDMLNVLNEIL